MKIDISAQRTFERVIARAVERRKLKALVARPSGYMTEQQWDYIVLTLAQAIAQDVAYDVPTDGHQAWTPRRAMEGEDA